MHAVLSISQTVDPVALLTLMGSLYACLSVLIVFQMFALQSWYGEAVELDRFSYDIDEKAMTDSLERGQAAARLLDHKRHYPAIQIVGLCGATLTICGLAIILGTRVRTISYPFTIGPGIVLAVTSLGVTAAVTVRGLATLKAAASRLE